jgi:hypothetical protein
MTDAQLNSRTQREKYTPSTQARLARTEELHQPPYKKSKHVPLGENPARIS